MNIFARILIIAAAITSMSATGERTRQLTFEDRVRAQEAIERVYYAHQIDAKTPFVEAIPHEVLERKVRTYLTQSVALQGYWNTPITADSLQRELERIIRETRFPDRLNELFASLGDDSFLIQECFVRQVLAERLARSFFSSDERIHGQAHRLVEKLRDDLKTGRASSRDHNPRRDVVEFRLRQSEAGLSERPAAHAVPVIDLDEAEFNRWRSSAPNRVGEISDVGENLDSFVISALLSERPGAARMAIYRVPKVSWTAWWEEAGRHWRWEDAQAVANPARLLTQNMIGSKQGISGAPESSLTCDTESRWTRSFTDLPDPRDGHSAVWTGSLMLVWGGQYGNEPFLNRGNRYDPLTDTWTVMTTANAPQGRYGQSAVWTGAEMIIWGGAIAGTYAVVNTGSRYNPQTDSWLATSTIGAPAARQSHTAVWTGTEMIIWGAIDRGGRYSPATDTWAAVSAIGEPAGRIYHTAIWTGSTMVIWGGDAGAGWSNTGGRYDPGADTWQPTTLTGAPSPRRFHTSVWTGAEMIVWGGETSAPGTPGGGARYDPVNDSWRAVAEIDAPINRYDHTAVWTGERMLVWGGYSGGTLNSGGAYDPSTDRWRSLPTTNAPSARKNHTAIWTGDLMIIWGARTNTGGRYDPRTNSWTPTSASQAPSPRSDHTSVWTGSLMITWGGRDDVGMTNTGARYDPLTDTWSSTSVPSGLTSRYSHKAVWTGSEMIVWAGNPASATPGGDRYNPVTDSWMPMSTVNAPYLVSDSTAVWTGSEMIVWSGSSFYNGGGRYNPASNTWRPVSTTNAPSARERHTAVWTGSEMIVWGGQGVTFTNMGGRYNPVTDTWMATSTVNAPSPRIHHTAVWTGSEMIIWGGQDLNFSPLPDTGARYRPSSDTWTPSAISTTAVRSYHTAVWNGWVMIVWGGFGSGVTDSGGIYEPISDTFVPTPLPDAPSGRNGHTAVWADHGMIVWGGGEVFHPNSTGGILSVTHGFDEDGDGVSVCEGDCDDTHGSVYPGAPQLCDGLNNDCSDPLWPAVPAAERDDDGDGFRFCANDCDDSNAGVYPGAPQICGDNINNDCNDPRWPDPGEIDADHDGFKGCNGDCDDTRATVFPGAPQLCDGINNDCSDWRWPQVWEAELDVDGDGLSTCEGDCDDSRRATYPGAPEINDGRDNQCSGDAGYGAIDELTGELSWLGPGPTPDLCWAPQIGASYYEVARSGGPSFTAGCQLGQTNATCWKEPQTPLPGQLFFYLLRPRAPNIGSWGQDSNGAPRSSVCTGAASVYTFTFLDTVDDDIAATSLRDFFTAVPSTPSSYLFFGVDGSPTGGALCTERADFHRNTYLGDAGNSGGGWVTSGSWNKWYRGVSGSWSAPTTSSFTNYYGNQCYEKWAWCPDYELGNLMLYVRPGGPPSCEIAQNYPEVCGGGTWRLTIRISEDRFVACGF